MILDILKNIRIAIRNLDNLINNALKRKEINTEISTKYNQKYAY